MSPAANRYAKALYMLSQEHHLLDATHASLMILAGLIRENLALNQFLCNPLLTVENKTRVLNALFELKIPSQVLRFLMFLAYKNRLNILTDIIESFDHLFLKENNQVRAVVQTALTLSDADKITINSYLQEKLKSQVLPTWEIKASLLGGFRIYAQGWVYDSSFKSQLSNFYQQMIQAA